MSLFSFFSRRPKINKKKNHKSSMTKACLKVEALEDRSLPSATSISGFVFADANNNGIYDSGETAIANAAVQLRDAGNNIIGNTTTDANGFYQFNQDPTINQAPLTITKTLTFPSTQTDYTLPGTIAQFDSSLGQLQSVQITHAGSITSDIKVENTSTLSPSMIAGTVGGSLELTGPGVDSKLTMSQNAGSFNASSFDGTLDYGGTSGTDFGAKTANGTQTVSLTGSDMTPYIGTSTVAFTENAHASSYASGGGNLNVELNSSGMSTVTVVYNYIPNDNLKPGNYTIVQAPQPNGYTDGKISANGTVISHQPNMDIIPVTLDGINNSTNNDFGKLVPAGISGYVYFDANNNGTMDPGETGIAGTQIPLTGTDNNGPVTATATTNANGFYQFPTLNPGTYTVQETPPANWLQGKDTAGSLGGTVTTNQIAAIGLPSGGDSTNNDFGELKPSSLSGFVYLDANNNGVKDSGETGIAGVTVTLTGTDTNGLVNKTAITDANGAYQFANLDPGTYVITKTPPANYFDGKDAVGSQGGTLGTDLFSNITLPAGVDGVNNNFGELTPSNLSGFVYLDANNNGIKDSGEAGIAGVTVTLTGTGTNGPVSQTTTTDANGAYQFANLAPGTYVITKTPPANYFDGKDAVGSQGGILGTDLFSNITLPAGVDGVNNDFGELTPASLSGYVYADANNNGVKDAGETGISGVTITLSGTNAGGQVSQTATTDATGYYQFQTLMPGTYTITETPPANYFDGKDAIGSQGGTVGNDVLSNIGLAAGVQGINNDFAELPPAGLSGYVYLDSNNNGIKDPGEPAIAGVAITLTGFTDQGPISQQATTDANGFYQFQNLRPGNYAITETPPANYIDGKDTIGSQGGTVSQDNFSNIALNAGVLGINNNFAVLPPANADLSIVKTASASSVLVGSPITYTLTVTNNGPSTAQNVKVVDTLPPDAIYQNASGTGWTITQVNGTITADLSSLASGAVSQFTVGVKAPAVADTLTNTATVSATTPDSNPNNNTSTVTTTVYNEPGTTFPQGITPLVNGFGSLPALGKIQLFGIDTTPYISPTLRDQMTFVSGAYETILGRAPSYSEFSASLSQLQAGASTATIANNLFNSTEHRAQQATSLFETFLGRAPSSSELASAVTALQNGTSEINLSLGLVNSAEYQTSHPTPGTIVAGLYENILNQVPDASTQLQAVSALANETVSALAQSLMTSAAGLANIVDNAYLAILRRQPTANEVQTWVTQLQNNQVSFDQMQIDLLASSEFYQLAANSTKTR